MITQIKQVEVEQVVWKEIHSPIKAILPNNRDTAFAPKQRISWWDRNESYLNAGRNVFVELMYNPVKLIVRDTTVTLIENRVKSLLEAMNPKPTKKKK